MRTAVLGLVIAILSTAFPIYAATTVTNPLSSFTRNDNSYQTDTIGTSNSGTVVSWFYVPSASHNICQVYIPLRSQGNPIDSVQLQVYYAQNYTVGSSINFTTPDDSGISGLTPDNATYRSAAVASIQVRNPSSFVEEEYDFFPCLIVAGGSGYWFKLSRTGSLDNSNYYQAGGQVDGGGGSYVFGGTSGEAATNWLYTHYVLNSTWIIPGSHEMSQIVLGGSQNLGVTGDTQPIFGSSVSSTIQFENASGSPSSATQSVSSLVGIPGYFANKVPWGYIFAIRDDYNSAATSSTEYGAMVFDFTDNRISTGTRNWLPGRLVVFSTTTVTHYLAGTPLDAANTLANAVGWLAMIVYWFRRAVAT